MSLSAARSALRCGDSHSMAQQAGAWHLPPDCTTGRVCTRAGTAAAERDKGCIEPHTHDCSTQPVRAATVAHHCVSVAAPTCLGLAHAGALTGWGLPNSSSSRPKPSRPRAAELLAPAGLPLSSGALPEAWPISSRCSISCHNERSPCTTQRFESLIYMQHLMPLAADPLHKDDSALPVQLRSICATGSNPLDERQCRTTSGPCSISCHREHDPCTAAMLLFQCTPFLRQVGLSLHETESSAVSATSFSLGRPSCPCVQLHVPHCVNTVQHCLALQHEMRLPHCLPDSQTTASSLERAWQHQAHSRPAVWPDTQWPAGEAPNSQASGFPAT